MNTLLIRDAELAKWLLSNPVVNPEKAVDVIFVCCPLGPAVWPVVDGARK